MRSLAAGEGTGQTSTSPIRRIGPVLPSGSNIKLLAESKIALQPGLKLALAFICAIAPTPALAYQTALDGWLFSDNPSDPPVPITLNLEVNLAGVSGTVKTGSPQPGAGVLRGDEQLGICDLRSDLGRLTLLRMKGGCGPAMSSFNGKYVLSLSSGKRQAGSFKLSRTSTPDERLRSGSGDSARQPGELSSLTPARCLKANSACLLACPRGDQSAELLCANRCKQKLKACKGRGSWAPEVPEPRDDGLNPLR